MGLCPCPCRAALLPGGLLFLLLLADPALPAGRPPPVVLGLCTTEHPGPPSFLMVWMCMSPALGRPSHWSSWTPAKAVWAPIFTPWWKALWAGATHGVRMSREPPTTGAEPQEMIEAMYQLYGGPVVLVAHSMGNMYTLYFLQRQPQAWKDKYIRAFVALGAPWGGVAKTLRVLASGDNNRIPVISPLKIREQQRSAVSTSWLLPYNYTWSPEKVFVRTPTTNYTLRDYHQFFQDIGFEDGWLMRQDTEGLVETMVPPGVQMHCLYGTGVPTPDSFYYESLPDRDPKIYFGDGDGTVNLQSALHCQTWRNHQEQEVSLQALPGSEHIEMLANATTLAYLKRVLLGP
ncbi:PREDICTED: group XV phospholipase A2 isoform X3 [Hipposideros armiger]|uniref:Group XV phospholipase A2 isoform X3 n=1 Tax=Hipposideros armiger TaxID=186990 RepID=A0A8B7SDK1_HIPAR|nr:PREDICTED: group XV phospholipase A2 isoform X3 [Hipposideros armiger]